MKIAVISDRATLDGNIMCLTEGLFLLVVDEDTFAYQSRPNSFADRDEVHRETFFVFDLVAEDAQILVASKIPPDAGCILEDLDIRTYVGLQGTVEQVIGQLKRLGTGQPHIVLDDTPMDQLA